MHASVRLLHHLQLLHFIIIIFFVRRRRRLLILLLYLFNANCWFYFPFCIFFNFFLSLSFSVCLLVFLNISQFINALCCCWPTNFYRCEHQRRSSFLCTWQFDSYVCDVCSMLNLYSIQNFIHCVMKTVQNNKKEEEE